jgi:hypothetical protein
MLHQARVYVMGSLQQRTSEKALNVITYRHSKLFTISEAWILWLPPEHRPGDWASQSDTIVIGSGNGRVTLRCDALLVLIAAAFRRRMSLGTISGDQTFGEVLYLHLIPLLNTQRDIIVLS